VSRGGSIKIVGETADFGNRTIADEDDLAHFHSIIDARRRLHPLPTG
jgi:hypothetical protein